MNEYFEIKRKNFNIVTKLGERSYKVERKGKYFFLKDFENDKKGFETYVDSEWKLNVTGIHHPKIYVYDKNLLLVASEYIEGNTVEQELMNADLPEKYFELLFKANWFVKKEKMPISFEPEKWKLTNGNLYYLGIIEGKFEDKPLLERGPLRLWFYSKDFAKNLVQKGLPVNKERVPDNEAISNKQMALMVAKYYI